VKHIPENSDSFFTRSFEVTVVSARITDGKVTSFLPRDLIFPISFFVPPPSAMIDLDQAEGKHSGEDGALRGPEFHNPGLARSTAWLRAVSLLPL